MMLLSKAFQFEQFQEGVDLVCASPWKDVWKILNTSELETAAIFVEQRIFRLIS